MSTYTTAQTGEFFDNATWVGGVVPDPESPGNTLNIDHSISVSSNALFGGGVILNINSSGIFAINGVPCQFATGSLVNVNTGGLLYVLGPFSTTFDTGSLLTIAAGGSMDVEGAGYVTVGGTVSVASTGILHISLDAGGGTLLLGNTCTVDDSGAVEIGSQGVVSVGGHFILEAGAALTVDAGGIFGFTSGGIYQPKAGSVVTGFTIMLPASPLAMRNRGRLG